jgi:hypothetical protein
LLVGACGKPPDLERPPPRPSAAASLSPSLSLSLSPSVRPTGTPGLTVAPVPTAPASSPTGFGESTAVACGGRPAASDVLAVLRRAGVVTRVGAQVVTGPMCAGTWQWSIVRMPDADPLQVVTRGPARALRLVTAGTNVCSVQVRSTAPAGIRAAACDARPPGL